MGPIGSEYMCNLMCSLKLVVCFHGLCVFTLMVCFHGYLYYTAVEETRSVRYGHTLKFTPHPIPNCEVKLDGPVQYWGGGPPGKFVVLYHFLLIFILSKTCMVRSSLFFGGWTDPACLSTLIIDETHVILLNGIGEFMRYSARSWFSVSHWKNGSHGCWSGSRVKHMWQAPAGSK